MSSLPSPRAPRPITVSELNRSVRNTLEASYPVLWVTGELSNLTRAASGHWYFSLKDSGAQVRCVMFRNRAQLLDWQPREGVQVDIRAVISLYEARGDFQLTVEYMRRGGLGALFEAFERLKQQLALEGLFAAERKRPVPRFPQRVGVLTSLQGAALHDVLSTLQRRMPSLAVVVYPTAVQGDEAVPQLVAALQRIAARREVDVLLVCRGGGSLEDLWSFNDEAVVRALAACPMPVITGIGHETDITLADFVADVRAPTPTAAAELVSPQRLDLERQLAAVLVRMQRAQAQQRMQRALRLDELSRRLISPTTRLIRWRERLQRAAEKLAAGQRLRLERRQWQIQGLLQRLGRSTPAAAAAALRLNGLRARLQRAAAAQPTMAHTRLARLATALELLDPHQVLSRGYGIVRTAEGKVLANVADTQINAILQVSLADGALTVQVQDVTANSNQNRSDP